MGRAGKLLAGLAPLLSSSRGEKALAKGEATTPKVFFWFIEHSVMEKRLRYGAGSVSPLREAAGVPEGQGQRAACPEVPPWGCFWPEERGRSSYLHENAESTGYFHALHQDNRRGMRRASINRIPKPCGRAQLFSLQSPVASSKYNDFSKRVEGGG